MLHDLRRAQGENRTWGLFADGFRNTAGKEANQNASFALGHNDEICFFAGRCGYDFASNVPQTDPCFPRKAENLRAKVRPYEIPHPRGGALEKVIHAQPWRQAPLEQGIWLAWIGELPGRKMSHMKKTSSALCSRASETAYAMPIFAFSDRSIGQRIFLINIKLSSSEIDIVA
jgi:hypothetical protein